MTSDTQERAAEIRRLLAEEGDPVSENTRGFNEGRYETVAQLEDYQGLKDRARRIKEDAIERLPELIEEVTDAVEADGGTVYLADDAAEANRYVRQVVDRSGDTVVKSKSMTTEEIALNDALRSDGV
jgi:L-lactate utilization protein LutB